MLLVMYGAVLEPPEIRGGSEQRPYAKNVSGGHFETAIDVMQISVRFTKIPIAEV
jgi:hypothetical protein